MIPQSSKSVNGRLMRSMSRLTAEQSFRHGRNWMDLLKFRRRRTKGRSLILLLLRMLNCRLQVVVLLFSRVLGKDLKHELTVAGS